MKYFQIEILDYTINYSGTETYSSCTDKCYCVTNSAPKFSWRFRKSTVGQMGYLQARPRSLQKRRIRTYCPGCRTDGLEAYSGPSLLGIYLKRKTTLN